MQKRAPVAGGLFIALGILGGFAWGAGTGAAMLGVLAGTAMGVGLALLVWLLERRP